MKMDCLEVRDRHGLRPVLGRRLSEAFGYTPEIDDREEGDSTTVTGPLRNVTHLPTGLWVMDEMPSVAMARKAAEAFEALPVDWREADEGKLAQACREAVGDIDEWCKALKARLLTKPERAQGALTTEDWMARLDRLPEWRGAEIVGVEEMALAEASGSCADNDCPRDHVMVRFRPPRAKDERTEYRHQAPTPVVVVRLGGATLRLRLTEAMVHSEL